MKRVKVGLVTDCVFGGDEQPEMFNSSIMHQKICTKLFNATVADNASASNIAREFGLNEKFVRDHWFTAESVTPPPEEAKPRSSARKLVYSKPADMYDVFNRLLVLAPNEMVIEATRFSRRHEDVKLSQSGTVATRTGNRGTYRCVQGTQELSKGRGDTSYFEVRILEKNGPGGLCVGIAGKHHTLNRLVGFDNQSIGLFSSGEILHDNAYLKVCEPFGAEDRVGVLMRTVHIGGSPVTAQDSKDSTSASNGAGNSPHKEDTARDS